MSQNKKQYNEPSLTVEELSKALYESNLKLNNIMHERDDFYKNISHDLRSPIAAIRGAIETLQSSPDIDKERVTELYSLIDSKTRSLEHMINELFFLTKISTGDSLLNQKTIPIGNYLEDFFFTTQTDSKFDSIDLQLDVPLDFSYPVDIDTNYFDRVLNNLFDNAFRYLDEDGFIRLGASVDEEKKNVSITVTDNAIGIPAEVLPRIFERSFMVDSSRNPSKDKGAGLGLSICKTITELHGGTISCESKTGSDHGTAFTITLPVSRS